MMRIVGMLVIANWSWNLIRAFGAVLLDMRPDKQIVSEITHRLEAGCDDRVSDLHLWRTRPQRRWCRIGPSRPPPTRRGLPVSAG
jgi:Co/Zn/Cd efflux system component